MITRERSGREIELRSFTLNDMRPYGWTDSVGGGYGSEGDMRGIPAINRAARLRAEAVGKLQLKCYSGDGVDRRERPLVWQAQLFAGAPNEYQTRFGFWDTIEESMAYRNNAYIWKNIDPMTGRVIEWYALHPNQVTCKPDKRYEVNVTTG